jgi:hypothetical protein
MVALRVRIVLPRCANAQNSLHNCRIGACCISQFDPIRASAALDNVINRGSGKTLMNEVAMFHVKNGRRIDRRRQA